MRMPQTPLWWQNIFIDVDDADDAETTG